MLVAGGATAAGAALFEAGCLWKEDEMTELTEPPWKMWGQSKVTTLTANGAGQRVLSGQFVNVQYRRPESWHFLFVCQPISLSNGWGGNSLEVDILLTTGVGMDTAEWSFQLGTWLLPADTGPRVLAQIPGLPRFTGDTRLLTIDQIPAQTIQVQAALVETGAAAVGETVTMKVSAYFAPKNHIRPDWFKHHFAGELGGR